MPTPPPSTKPPADFVIRLTGKGTRSWSVPLRRMTAVMDAVQRLVEQRDEFSLDGEGSGGEESPLQLLQVTSGSAAYRVAASDRDRALKVFEDTGRQIHAPARVDWTSASLSAIDDLSQQARAMDVEVEFRGFEPSGRGTGGKAGPVLARIGPDTFDRVTAAAFVTGRTSLFGKVERVGGVTDAKCGLRVPAQKRMVICRVATDELTRKLGRFVYQHLMVHGEATWLRGSGFVRSFVIEAVDEPASASLDEVRERVREATDNPWDAVEDREALLAELRA